MTQQSPRSRLNPKNWSAGTIALFVIIVAVFIAMLTWDRGHFEQKQPPGAQKSQPK